MKSRCDPELILSFSEKMKRNLCLEDHFRPVHGAHDGEADATSEGTSPGVSGRDEPRRSPGEPFSPKVGNILLRSLKRPGSNTGHWMNNPLIFDSTN